MKKTALVAGAAGFLGSYFCQALLECGWQVVGVDNLLTGKKSNLADCLKNPDSKFVKCDIAAPPSQILTSKIYHLIANFACPASPQSYTRYPLETLRASSIGVENLLKLAKKNHCRFFHASTSEVYGDPLIHPQKENYWGNVNPYGSRSMYDEGKRFAEALIWVYRKKYQVNTGIARIFNTYGPRMQAGDGRVVPNFIAQALRNRPITVYGRGEQTRSFCYVEDEIAGLMRMALADFEGPINIGNPQEFTILELAKKVIALTKSKSIIVFQPLPPDDPRQRRPDISLAKKLLNWSPQTSLDNGLKKTIDWMRIGKQKQKSLN